MSKKIIKVKLDNIKNIKNAEKTKTKLENKGYILQKTVMGFNEASLIYTKRKNNLKCRQDLTL